jgi:hypothetical protein
VTRAGRQACGPGRPGRAGQNTRRRAPGRAIRGRWRGMIRPAADPAEEYA